MAALGVLVAVQFGTTTNTVINSEDTGELLGLWPLVALIWIGFLASAAIGFGAASLIDRRVRPA